MLGENFANSYTRILVYLYTCILINNVYEYVNQVNEISNISHNIQYFHLKKDNIILCRLFNTFASMVFLNIWYKASYCRTSRRVYELQKYKKSKILSYRFERENCKLMDVVYS